MTVDWAFWIMFSLPLVMGLAAGWTMRGQWEVEREELRRIRREALMRDVERAKQRHPAYRDGEGWTL